MRCDIWFDVHFAVNMSSYCTIFFFMIFMWVKYKGGYWLINLVLYRWCWLRISLYNIIKFRKEEKKKVLPHFLLLLCGLCIFFFVTLWFVYLFCSAFVVLWYLKLSFVQLSQVQNLWVNQVELEIFLSVFYKHYIFH